MLEREFVPRLAQLAAQPRREQRTWVLALQPEGEVDAALEPLYRKLGRQAVTVLATPGLVRVRVTLRPSSRETWTTVDAELRKLLGPAVFEEGAFGLEGAVVQNLRLFRQTVAVAESCTGGGIGARLTRVPGASEVFLGGVIAYANSVKRKLLGVSVEALEREGAVSAEVVQVMARAAAEQTGADWGIGVSGIAGPSGGSLEKPVGTVFLALSSSNGFSKSWAFRFPGDRARVRSLAEVAALELLRRELLRLEGPVSWSARP
jgi:nicotinamide-nucleotide amidase